MEAKKMKIAELHAPEKNVRVHTEAQIKEFEKSIRMFGQLRPIVVDETNTILAGNGLCVTLQRMGIEEADVYVMEGLTEAQKKKLMIADNKIFQLGVENMDVLNEFLEDLHGDYDIPGFDEDILRQMMADTDEIDAQISGYGTIDPEEVRQMRERADRREQEAAEPENADNGSMARNTPSQQADGATDGSNGAAEGEDRRFVICPSCGARVWL